MKQVVVIFILIVAAVAGYLIVMEPETLDRLKGEKTVEESVPKLEPEPKNNRPAKKSTPKPKPKKVESVAVKPAILEIPQMDMEIFVNGEPAKPGKLEFPPGHFVVSGWTDNGFVHDSFEIKEGATHTVALKTRKDSPSQRWESFQGGPKRTGHVAFSDRNDLVLKWKADHGEKVQSSPIIIGDTAYFSSANRLLTAVNLADGEQVWSNGELGSKVSPVANDSHIFVGDNSGRFAGYLLKNGKRKGFEHMGSYPTSLAMISNEAFLVVNGENRVFSIKTKKRFTGKLPLKINWELELPELKGTTANPVVVGGKAVFPTETGALVAVDLEKGERVWPTQGEGRAEMQGNMQMSFVDDRRFLTPTPVVDGVKVIACSPGKIFAVNADTGATLWEKELKASISSSLSLAHGLVYAGGSDGLIYAFSSEDGGLAYARKISDKAVFASPVLFKDKILVATGEGRLLLLNAFTGKTVAQNQDLAGASIDSTPAVSGNYIFAINRKGVMACFE